MKKTIATFLISSALALGTFAAFANHHEGNETEKHEYHTGASLLHQITYLKRIVNLHRK